MKIAVIVNPRACRHDIEDLKDQLTALLRSNLQDLQSTAFPGHGTYLAKSYANQGVDIVVAVGGDGTANEVLNGLVGTRTALGLIPTGTANDLATHLQIPQDIQGAAAAIAGSHLRSLDVVRVNGWHYLTVGGLGLPSETAQLAQALRSKRIFGSHVAGWLGTRIYLIALFQAFMRCHRHRHIVTVSTGNGSFCVDTSSLLLANQPFLGSHFRVAPKARPDDSLLDLCLIRHDPNRLRLALATLAVALGRQSSRSSVTRLRTRRLHIHTVRPQAFMADGQIQDAATHFDIELLPSAINVVVPEKRGRR